VNLPPIWGGQLRSNVQYPPHLAEENKHVGKCLGCQLWVKDHGRGPGLLGVEEAILEGLLIGQNLDVIRGHIGPVINFP
jgi:hypothetical protein